MKARTKAKKNNSLRYLKRKNKMQKNEINTTNASAGLIGRQSWYALMMMLAITFAAFLPASTAWGHGERMHSPSLRMRSIQFFDMKWEGAGDIQVNDLVTITGKMFFPKTEHWPKGVELPKVSYLQSSGPASVFTKVESYIDDKPMVQSTGMKLGRTYQFKLVMKARVPGAWHIHPTIQIAGSGPIVGPGEWATVSGEMSDFKQSGVAGIDGEVIIDDLSTYTLDFIIGWHALWFVIGFIWLFWWIRRPTLLPRYRAVQEGVDKKLLVTATDKKMGFVMLIVVLTLTIGGALNANSKHPDILPLQSGLAPVEPLPLQNHGIKILGVNSQYNIARRAMTLEVEVTNESDKAMQISEFATAGIRFVRSADELDGVRGATQTKSITGYPVEYIREVLTIEDGSASPILPGEHRTFTIVAADAVWEIQNLSELVLSPVRRTGGLVFFIDEEGNRFHTFAEAGTDIAYD